MVIGLNVSVQCKRDVKIVRGWLCLIPLFYLPFSPLRFPFTRVGTPFFQSFLFLFRSPVFYIALVSPSCFLFFFLNKLPRLHLVPHSFLSFSPSPSRPSPAVSCLFFLVYLVSISVPTLYISSSPPSPLPFTKRTCSD